MAIPSLQYLSRQAIFSFRRFPSVILSSVLAAIAAVMLIALRNSDNHLPLLNIMLCTALGVPFFLSLLIYAEKKEWKKNKLWIAHGIAIVILTLIYFSFPASETARQTYQPYLRFVMYVLSANLAVSFMPFFGEKQINGFWQFNRILFLRLFISVLYSGVLFAGISLAAVAIDQLFGVKVNYTFYGQCFAVIAFVFNTWFFISGIPKQIADLDHDTEYPKGLRIFAQYILLALLALYLIILYAYGTKILITWNWPKGIVSYLVVYVSILGTLSFLLLYPYSKSEEYTWIKTLTKWFYGLLIPLLFILFMAIFMRIDDYGITENRYIVLALGIWLTVVSLYQLIGNGNIKFIPTSLAIVPLLISFGPWSMFSVSEYYQVKRLKLILEKSKILANGKIQNESLSKQDTAGIVFTQKMNDTQISDSLKKEVVSIMRYLDEYHGFASVQTWFSQDLEGQIKKLESINAAKSNRININEADIYMGALGINYNLTNESEEAVQFFMKEEHRWADIRGFDAMAKIHLNNNSPEKENRTKDVTICSLKFSDKSNRDLLWEKDSLSLLIPLGNWLDKNLMNNKLFYLEWPIENLRLQAESQTTQVVLYINRLRAVKKKGQWSVDDAEFLLLQKNK